MSIFQLLSASEHIPSSHFGFQLRQSQAIWKKFKASVDEFLRQPSSSIQKSLESIWVQIQNNCPEMSQMAADYFSCVVIKMLKDLTKTEGQLTEKNQGQQNLDKRLKNFVSLLEPSFVYLNYINRKQLTSKMFEEVKLNLSHLKINQTFAELFKCMFHKHCQKILNEQMIDLEDKTKEYIENNINEFSKDTSQQLVEFKSVLESLAKIDLLQWFLEPAFQFLNHNLYDFIANYIDPNENKEFHRQCLNYQRTFQRSFLKSIVTKWSQKILEEYINQMDNSTFFLCIKFCCSHILDIILEYPDSYPAILSLKHSLEHLSSPQHTFISLLPTPLHQISECLQKQISSRLLLPGVLTQNILNQYINILKVLQLIDPHGFIFDQITLPIKQYLLLARTDTLRCIISFMTDDVENYSRLQSEKIKIPSKEYIEEELNSDNDEQGGWGLLSVESRDNKGRSKIRVKYQESDLISVLVGLYGSQEAFLSEYQNMLAEKLMSAKDYNIQEQIKNIQLLKLRFGQNALQTCNIIVKDVKDSKRLDKQIHKIQPKNKNSPINLQNFNCLAVSKGYWPINYQSSTSDAIPEVFKQIFDEYSEHFSSKKSMRKIQYHYNLGNVNLTLTFNNGNFDFKCMPIHAMMITCFDEQHIRDKNLGVSSEQLAGWLGISQNVAKQKMAFWVHKGVVKEQRMPKTGLSLKRITSFQDGQLVYYKPVEEYQHVASDQIDDDIDNLIIKESTTTESNLKHIIEGLIISILSINGPKSPQKIHLLLKTIYKTDLDYTYGENQTLEILKKMVQKKKINFNGETYLLKSQ